MNLLKAQRLSSGRECPIADVTQALPKVRDSGERCVAALTVPLPQLSMRLPWIHRESIIFDTCGKCQI